MRDVAGANECLLVNCRAQAEEVLCRTGDLQGHRESVCPQQYLLPVWIAVAVVPGAVFVDLPRVAGWVVISAIDPSPITHTLRPSLRLSRYSSPVIISQQPP